MNFDISANHQRSHLTPSHYAMCQYVECHLLLNDYSFSYAICWMLVHACATSPGKFKWSGPHHTIKILHFVLFHSVTCYTNSIVLRIHVNTTKLRNIMCTLVASVILRSLECTMVDYVLTLSKGHFTHETKCPWPLHFKHSHWWERWKLSKFASHYAWRTNGVCGCNMDVMSTWSPTWHRMDHVSWSLGLLSITTSWRRA